MFAPSEQLVKEYSQAIVSANDPQDRHIQELIRDYIVQNLSPEPRDRKKRRAMMLLFKGEDAVRKMRAVVGNISAHRRGGETIRDTYGDLILDENDMSAISSRRFSQRPMPKKPQLKAKLWARYSDTDGGILE